MVNRNFVPLHETLLLTETFQKLCSLTLLSYIYMVHHRNFASLNVLSSELLLLVCLSTMQFMKG